MEKGYRDYHHDIDNPNNPYEDGLVMFVKLKQADDIIEKEARI